MNSMLGKLKGLGVSTESAPALPVVAPEPVMPVEMDTDSVPMLDASAAEVDTAVSKYDQLEQLAATLESMTQAAGMSDTEYALFNHASNAITDGTPIAASTPALESFGTAAARLNNAQVALESVGDKLKAAADWIKKTVAEFLRMMAEVFQRWASAIEPTIEKMESRDYSVLSQLSKDMQLELELSDTKILSIRDGMNAGDFTVTLKKLEHWVDKFSHEIIPNSRIAVETLIKNSDESEITNEMVSAAIAEAFKTVDFKEEESKLGTLLVTEPLFGSVRLERRDGGYVTIGVDFKNYSGVGAIPAILEKDAENIRDLSIKILKDLKLMSELPDAYRKLFEHVESSFSSSSTPAKRTVVRAVMANAKDTTMAFYRDAIACIKTIDILVVASMKEATKKKGFRQ